MQTFKEFIEVTQGLAKLIQFEKALKNYKFTDANVDNKFFNDVANTITTVRSSISPEIFKIHRPTFISIAQSLQNLKRNIGYAGRDIEASFEHAVDIANRASQNNMAISKQF